MPTKSPAKQVSRKKLSFAKIKGDIYLSHLSQVNIDYVSNIYSGF